jgi:hypothetical protein
VACHMAAPARPIHPLPAIDPPSQPHPTHRAGGIALALGEEGHQGAAGRPPPAARPGDAPPNRPRGVPAGGVIIIFPLLSDDATVGVHRLALVGVVGKDL